MPSIHRYPQLSNPARNAAGNFYASNFEPSNTPTHAGDSSNSSQAPKHLGLDLICHLHGGRLVAMTSIFVNREMSAFMARACDDETLDAAALDSDDIEPDGLSATAFGPWKVSKVKAHAGSSLIFGLGTRSTYPATAPIQSQSLDREAVNDNHWRAAA